MSNFYEQAENRAATIKAQLISKKSWTIKNIEKLLDAAEAAERFARDNSRFSDARNHAIEAVALGTLLTERKNFEQFDELMHHM